MSKLRLTLTTTTIAAFLIIAIYACTKAPTLPDDGTDGGNGGTDTGGVSTTIQVIKDIQYGTSKDIVDSVHLKFDVYIPIGAGKGKKFPMVLFAHGGGFTTGDKEGTKTFMQTFAQAGFVGVTINYRLSGSVDQQQGACQRGARESNTAAYTSVQDMNAALRYVVAHADQYYVDTSRMFISGNSAGAVTVLNEHYLSQSDFNEVIPYVKLQYGALDATGNDLTNTFTIKGIAANSGCLPDIKYMDSADKVPTIFFHGIYDSIVPADTGTTYNCPHSQFVYGSLPMYDRLIKLGGTAVEHIYYGSDKEHLPYTDDFCAQMQICFFNSIIYKNAKSGKYSGMESSCP